MCCTSLSIGRPCKLPCPPPVSVFNQLVNPLPAPQKCAATPVGRWHTMSLTKSQWCKSQPALSWLLGIAMIWTNSSGSPWRDGSHILFGTIQTSEPIQRSWETRLGFSMVLDEIGAGCNSREEQEQTWGESERTCISIGQFSSETLEVHCKRYKNKFQMALSWLIKLGFAVEMSPSKRPFSIWKSRKKPESIWLLNKQYWKQFRLISVDMLPQLF